MKKLAQGAVATGAGTLLYSTPTEFKADVKDITFSNTTSSPISLKVHLVPTSGVVDSTNMFVPNVSVPGNTFVQWSGTQTLNVGDFVQGIASAVGMTISITGEEYRR